MKIEPETFMMIVAAILAILLLGGFLMAGSAANKFENSCLIAGGVPLKGYCVRPGAFMHIEEGK